MNRQGAFYETCTAFLCGRDLVSKTNRIELSWPTLAAVKRVVKSIVSSETDYFLDNPKQPHLKIEPRFYFENFNWKSNCLKILMQAMVDRGHVGPFFNLTESIDYRIPHPEQAYQTLTSYGDERVKILLKGLFRKGRSGVFRATDFEGELGPLDFQWAADTLQNDGHVETTGSTCSHLSLWLRKIQSPADIDAIAALAFERMQTIKNETLARSTAVTDLFTAATCFVKAVAQHSESRPFLHFQSHDPRIARRKLIVFACHSGCTDSRYRLRQVSLLRNGRALGYA